MVTIQMKPIALITLLVFVLAATNAKAQFIDVFEVAGSVSCTNNVSLVLVETITGTVPLPFPNAIVDLTCDGNVRDMDLTNAMGAFSMILSPSEFNLNTLLTSCKIVLATPLSSCNSTLPSTRTIQAPLELVNTNTFGDFLSATILAPGKGVLVDD